MCTSVCACTERTVGVKAGRPQICSRVVTPLRLFLHTTISTRFPHACANTTTAAADRGLSCFANYYYYYHYHSWYTYRIIIIVLFTRARRPRLSNRVFITCTYIIMARARRPRGDNREGPRRRRLVVASLSLYFVRDGNLETRERKLVVTVIFDRTACANIKRKI